MTLRFLYCLIIFSRSDAAEVSAQNIEWVCGASAHDVTSKDRGISVITSRGKTDDGMMIDNKEANAISSPVNEALTQQEKMVCTSQQTTIDVHLLAELSVITAAANSKDSTTNVISSQLTSILRVSCV